MPSPLKIRLSPEADKELLTLLNNSAIPKRIRQRAEALRLGNRGWKVREIADYLQVSPHQVRQSFYRWITRGMEGLSDAPRTGRKRLWREEDLEYLEEYLENAQRTYNSYQLVEILKTERGINISRERLRKILKKKTGDGKERKKV